jgi:acetolactate synthase-1/2/3 large subunit
MRFSDRVTGNLKTYAKQAKVIHFDIDPSEIGKNVVPTLGVLGNVKETIPLVTEKVKKASHDEWIASFAPLEKREYEHVYVKEVEPSQGPLHMGEVVRHVSDLAGRDAVLVTDVGQNQMMGSRYFRFGKTRSNITSGGLGTMGYGIPAALGAKIGAPERRVCLFLGDGGLQMTLEEFGTIMQDSIGVKIILLNNNKLGMVRQWQELFNHQRYSFTDMANPDFCKIAEAYGIRTARVERREDLDKTIQDMFSDDKAFLLVAECEQMGMVYPMTPAGANVTDVMLEK